MVKRDRGTYNRLYLSNEQTDFPISKYCVDGILKGGKELCFNRTLSDGLKLEGLWYIFRL